MAGGTRVTVVGTLTADPELRLTAAGMPMAASPSRPRRAFGRDRGGRAHGEQLFVHCTLRRRTARTPPPA